MKRKINKIYILFFTLLFSVLFIGFSGNPPNGNTGAPGDSLCTGCHNNSNPNGFAGTVDVLNFPTSITPNTTYNLTAQIVYTSGTPVRAGFQAVVLDASNNNSGDLSTSDPNVAATTAGVREYVEHDPAQSFGAGTSVTYNFDWVAPNAPNGEVITLYIASLFGNGANGNSGDLTITNSISGTIDAGSSPPLISATSTDVSCFGGNDGTATAQGSGGTPSYTYAWSNGGSGATISNLTAGTYTVTVTDAGALTATTTAIVGQPTQLSLLLVNQTNVDCFANSTGSASVNGSGGTAGYSYSWSNGGSGATNSNLSAGTYTATVTDGNLCTSTEVVTITQPVAISLLATSTNVICNGDNNGTATAFGSGGGGGFSYAWSNGMFGQTISNLSAGTYTVTATDGNNCTQTESTSINQPNAIDLTTTSTNLSCSGDNNGTATAFGSGGGGGFSYAWSNGSSGQTISNLSAGTYTVTATDANNCFEVETVNVTEPNAISVNISPTNISCNGANDASATAIGNGGAGTFTFSWSNGMNGQTISNLSPGTYTVSVTDANNCTQTESISFTEPNAISVTISSTEISCNGENNGSASALGSGGAGGFNYVWSNGMNGPTISNLPAGTYTATATDANNCTQTESITIVEPSPINVTTSQNNILCNGDNNGSASASGNGGTGNITYTWSNGTSGASVSNLTAGTYTITATDENSCTQIETVTITEPIAINISIAQTEVNCFGNTNGAASANGSGGTGNLTYAWSNGMSGENISNLTAGTYTLTVTDSNNCTATESVTINQPSNLIVNASATGETSANANDGTATATPSGGTSGYAFSWSTGSSNQTISNLPPGSYTVTITDNNMCTAEETVIVSSFNCAISINVATTNALCFGETGSATASAQNGTDPVTYLWSTGETTATISNLTPGVSYSVTITDVNNCPASMSISISEPPVISPNATATAVTANGANDGTATSNPSGGEGSFTFLWSNGMTTSTISDLAPGDYTVTVTDGNNCTSTQTVTVNDISCAIAISTTSTNLLCFGDNNGTASVAVNTGTAPFTYLWSNGGMSETISNLVAGDYTVTVTDNNNCPVSETITISQPDLLELSESVQSVLQLDCFENNNGVAAIAVTGGAGGNTFNWSNGMMGNPISNLPAGTFTGTVTDANGCFEAISFTIAQPDELIASATATDETAANANDGTSTASTTGGTGTSNYLWSNGAMTASISNLTPGTYTVTATDANNCESIESIEVNAFGCSLTAAVSTTNATCFDATDGAATVTPSGGQNFTYAWSSGGILATETNLPPGTYTVTINDASNCTLIEMVTVEAVDNILPTAISQNISVDLDASGNVSITPSMIDDGSNDNCGGVTLDLDIIAFDCDNLGENTIILTVSDLAGNQDTTTAIVMVNDLLPPTITCPTDIVIDECTGLVTYGSPIFSDNCADPFLIFMNPPSGTIFPTGETEIVFIANDQSGNSTSCSFTVTIDHVLELDAMSTDSPCAGENLGTASAVATGTSATFDYLWSNGATTSNIMNLPPNTYTVTVTDDSGCTLTEVVIVTEPDVLEIILDNVTDESDFGANDGAIEVSINGGTGTLNYEWTLNGNIISTIEDPIGLAGGVYILTITDGNGCTLTSTEINVGTIVSNENLILEKNIQLFPNPANDQLFLDFDLAINFDFNITIHDVVGNVLLEKNANNISNQKLELEVSNLASGLYFVKIQTGDHVWVRKFILQK
ncbi:MAG: beta strand repeat-containing protein [Saprospiraceae bacterium]